MTSTITVATYNIFAPVAEPLRFYGQKARMARLPAAFQHNVNEKYAVDVLVVQESIVPEQHALLKHGMHKLGFHYSTSRLQGKLSQFKFVDGGVYIFSKYPIAAEAHHVFNSGCTGTDCLAAKGLAYAKIQKNKHVFHIVGTHFQAWESTTCQAIRLNQARDVGKFIAHLSDVEPNEPIVIAGDLNLDLYSQQAQLQQLQQAMQAVLVPQHPSSAKFSSDPHTNQLVGNDEDSAYASPKFTNGCYKEYTQTLSCPCCPSEMLDYVLVSTRGAMCDLPSSWYRVVPCPSTQPFITRINMTMQRKIKDVSDHYPVVARLTFPQWKPRSRTFAMDTLVRHYYTPGSSWWQSHWISMLFAMLLCTWVFVLIYCVRHDQIPQRD